MKPHPQVDRYMREEKKWPAEFAALRRLVQSHPLVEDFKWGHPCYTFEGRNVVLLHGFKHYCAILFCKGALLQDPAGILVQQTANVQAARQVRFKSVAEVQAQSEVLRAYLEEAIAVERAGREVEYKDTSEFARPAELEQRLHESPKLRAAFDALTPGRQRGYLLHFAAAKLAQTRLARIDKCTPQILAGKGLRD
ncbi:MAG: YdeI/OmpD-associated family protein [Verrucomicrobia bacterium]|nr:YdeI/OmpD-associated family protein [Verrucomicrobiota bacterium]